MNFILSEKNNYVIFKKRLRNLFQTAEITG